MNHKDFSQKFQHNAIFNCRVMSREHASIFYQDGSFFIRDLNSSNGMLQQLFNIKTNFIDQFSFVIYNCIQCLKTIHLIEILIPKASLFTLI